MASQLSPNTHHRQTDRQYCLTIYTTQSPLRALLTEMWALLAPCSLTNNSYMTT